MPTFSGNRAAMGVPATRGVHPVRMFGPQSTDLSDQSFTISGITKDSAGAVLAGSWVTLFETATGVFENAVLSDAEGFYTFFVRPNAFKFVRAYKAGAPDVAGTSVNSLVGV